MYAVPREMSDEEIYDILNEIDEYLSNLEDCDGDSQGMYPNKEMNLRNQLGPVLEQIEKRIKNRVASPVKN